MLVKYSKYHALKNDFIVTDLGSTRRSKTTLAAWTVRLCQRRTGVGADGVLYLSKSRKAYRKVYVYNADGSWAEKSGNGLRIAAVHMCKLARGRGRREFVFETAGSLDTVLVGKRLGQAYTVTVQLAPPEFETSRVPVKSRKRYMINSPLSIGGVQLPVTCLSVGNPHCVLVVNDFDFEWQLLGAEIERHRAFPNRTNVEFVKIVNRSKIHVADWERGAGATGSSGTGAAASVCAGIIMGLIDRKCEAVFQTGSLHVHWPEKTSPIALTGPVEYVTSGIYEIA
jgi:diaminopimelate epimerase